MACIIGARYNVAVLFGYWRMSYEIFVGFVIKPQMLIEEVELLSKFKRKTLFSAVIKYVAPVCIILILISSVLDALGIFKI